MKRHKTVIDSVRQLRDYSSIVCPTQVQTILLHKASPIASHSHTQSLGRPYDLPSSRACASFPQAYTSIFSALDVFMALMNSAGDYKPRKYTQQDSKEILYREDLVLFL